MFLKIQKLYDRGYVKMIPNAAQAVSVPRYSPESGVAAFMLLLRPSSRWEGPRGAGVRPQSFTSPVTSGQVTRSLHLCFLIS